MKFLKESNNTFVLGLFLAIIGAVAAVILAYVADITKAPKAKAKEAEINRALQDVLPKFDNSPVKNSYIIKAADATGYEVTFYGAINNGKLVGIAGKSITMKGYSGKIEAMVGLDASGTIRTVEVLKKQDAEGKTSSKAISAILITQQKETPGLGTVLCQRKNTVTLSSLFSDKKVIKTALPPNKYLDQFAGKTAPATPWQVIKDGGKIIYKTGATVTSRAVTDVVYRITHTYMVNKPAIDKQLMEVKSK
jgi:H+/Na+-translocating ferredoxin:NAD+ oxidoreductase subunit G